MKEVLSIRNIQHVSIFLYFALFVAMIYAIFLVTIVNIAMLVLAFAYQYVHRGEVKVRWWPLALMMVGFLPFAFGLLNSEDTYWALLEAQYTVTYVSIPLAIILLPALTKKQLSNVLGLLILLVAGSTIPVFVNYFLNFEEINQSLGMGQSIPTPIHHIRYSIFIAICCVFSFISFFRRDLFFERGGRRFYLFMSIYLFLCVHILATRSGIGLTYVGLVLSGSLLLFSAKKYGLIALLWGIMAISPVAAYYAIPSFQNKIKYTRYDLSLARSGQGANYSDSERIRSIKIGVDIWEDYKWLGIGTGDLRGETEKRYFEQYEEGRPFMSHNQFLRMMSMMGIAGLMLFLISFYGPLFWNRNLADPYVLALIGMLTVSFVFETTLENYSLRCLYVVLAALLYRVRGEVGLES